TVFLCNNNQWAISVPVAKQTASATLAEKANAYGFDGIRVDGMDALAVYRATRDAARNARDGLGPMMVEAVTYRIGPHSSSDDPSRYRDEAEVAAWQARDPLLRFRRYLEHAGWWDDAREARLEQEIGDEITRAVQEAERIPPPPSKRSSRTCTRRCRLTFDKRWTPSWRFRGGEAWRRKDPHLPHLRPRLRPACNGPTSCSSRASRRKPSRSCGRCSTATAPSREPSARSPLRVSAPKAT